MSTNEIKSAVEVAVVMAGCNQNFSTVYVPNDLMGCPRTDIACVKLSNNARISKAQLIEKGRALRAALREAGFKLGKPTVDCSWHMGHPADWFYNFKVGA
jgi:hypothetical protein